MNSTAIYQKINKILQDKIKTTINGIPVIHELSDGVVIRSFNEWEKLILNEDIRFRNIINIENNISNQTIYFVPKDCIIDFTDKENNKNITILNGKIELLYETGKKQIIPEYNSTEINEKLTYCKSMDDSYVIIN